MHKFEVTMDFFLLMIADFKNILNNGITVQGCQKEFSSSRLIMNSRWLWNSHQRHKLLRAEASRDILKFRVSEMSFPGG